MYACMYTNTSRYISFYASRVSRRSNSIPLSYAFNDFSLPFVQTPRNRAYYYPLEIPTRDILHYWPGENGKNLPEIRVYLCIYIAIMYQFLTRVSSGSRDTRFYSEVIIINSRVNTREWINERRKVSRSMHVIGSRSSRVDQTKSKNILFPIHPAIQIEVVNLFCAKNFSPKLSPFVSFLQSSISNLNLDLDSFA